MTLRITIEIVPFGDEYKRRVIEVVNVSNIGSIDDGVSNYAIEHNAYKVFDDDTPCVSHTRTDGALVLARKALEKLT